MVFNAVVKWSLFVLTLWLQQPNVSVAVGTETSDLIVNTTSGSVLGARRFAIATSINITTFLGVPYAEPPLGSLRFSKPIPKAPWNGVRDALNFGPMCPQSGENATDKSMDEDCLYLNIYIPDDAVAKLGPLPVMVWIHGGAFTSGSGSIYAGDVLAPVGEVIVVNLNYRLGLLGFFCTGDASAPGNFGLWDQRLAIRWVKNNIGNFGGNPDQMTIFGESAGSISVSFQAISPLNDRTLFQRVIAQSGASADSMILWEDQCLDIASTVGTMSGCANASSLVDCLRQIPALSFLELQLGVSIGPSLDGELIPDYVDNLLDSSRIGQYDLLTGVNSDDGSYFAIDPDGISADVVAYYVDDFLNNMCHCTNPEEVAHAMIFYYSDGDLTDPKANQKTVMNLGGDGVFFVPTVNNLRHHYKASQLSRLNTTTYSYYFSMKYLRGLFVGYKYLEYIDGAPHALDLMYMFGLVTVDPSPPNPGTELSFQMMAFWTNFAKTGNPNSDGLPFWPAWEPINETYIVLNENVTTDQHLEPGRMNLWLDYSPTLMEPKNPNMCPLNVPVRGETPQNDETRSLQIQSSDHSILGSVIGTIRRTDEVMGGKDVLEFLGIPYAQSTLDDKRFLPAGHVIPWADDQPIDCTIRPPACPQLLGYEPWMVNFGINETSEDCLTLNVYAPLTSNDLSMPIMVYLHHGSGLYGAASAYDATTISARSNAVVVVPNYRLGALGFLSTEDEVVPGNAGLHDVISVLNWIKEYIRSFGGDANRVTLVGNGFGASLAHLLATSDKSAGLFQRAVLIGGSAFTAPITNTVLMSPREKTVALAKKLSCPTDSSKAMVNCLQEKTSAELVQNTNAQDIPFFLPFGPTVDGDIFKDSPLDLIKEGKVNDIEYIIGINKNEMDYESSKFLNFPDSCPNRTAVEGFIKGIIPKVFRNPELVSIAVIREYLDRDKDPYSPCPNRDNFRLFLMDLLSSVPSVETARYHSSIGNNTVYFYSFDQDPKYHFNTLPSWAGTSFGDDLQYLFGFPYWPDSPFPLESEPYYRLSDKKTSLEWMKLISSFIDQKLSPDMSWPRYSSSDDKYLSVDSCPDVMQHAGKVEHTYTFWTEVVPLMVGAQSPVNPTDKPFSIGGGLGLSLSPKEANNVINGLFAASLCLAVLCVVLFIFIVFKTITRTRKSKSMFDQTATDNEYANPIKAQSQF